LCQLVRSDTGRQARGVKARTNSAKKTVESLGFFPILWYNSLGAIRDTCAERNALGRGFRNPKTERPCALPRLKRQAKFGRVSAGRELRFFYAPVSPTPGMSPFYQTDR
jgi:hypothetical protein